MDGNTKASRVRSTELIYSSTCHGASARAYTAVPRSCLNFEVPICAVVVLVRQSPTWPELNTLSNVLPIHVVSVGVTALY